MFAHAHHCAAGTYNSEPSFWVCLSLKTSPPFASAAVAAPSFWSAASGAVAVGVSCLLWALVQWLARGNLDGYHDMLENYAWAQAWDWGTHKHPPFFAWVVGVWFAVFPQNDFFYHLLSYVNVAVGLWGVWHLAARLGLRTLAPTAVLLLLWCLPYTTLAAKFNANSQLLSLWPWTAALLLASWQERGGRGLAYSVALGLLAGASMLSKYYSGVFLAGFLLPIFLSTEGRQWLRTPRPYLALAVFSLVLAPHLAWVAGHGWITLGYAMEQGSGATQWGYVLRFALAPWLYWLPGWLACVAVFSYQQAQRQGQRFWPLLGRLAWRSWLPTGSSDTLFWLAWAPWALTLGFGIAGVAELSSPWAIPIGFAFSLLWLRNMQIATPEATPAALHALYRAVGPVLAAVALVALALGIGSARTGQGGYYRPSAEAAQVIAQDWAQHHPALALGWVGGAWAENALLSFYALPKARTLPGLPDSYPALFNPHPAWQQQAGMLLCPRGTLRPDGSQPLPTVCDQQAQQWLLQRGQNATPRLLTAQRQGWRFPHPQTFVYAVFDVLPQPASAHRLP